MTPNSTGEFPGQCYQLCGYSHGNMRERAIIQSPADFEAWLTAQQQPAAAPPPDPAASRRAGVPDEGLHRLPHHQAARRGRAKSGPT